MTWGKYGPEAIRIVDPDGPRPSVYDADTGKEVEDAIQVVVDTWPNGQVVATLHYSDGSQSQCFDVKYGPPTCVPGPDVVNCSECKGSGEVLLLVDRVPCSKGCKRP